MKKAKREIKSEEDLIAEADLKRFWGKMDPLFALQLDSVSETYLDLLMVQRDQVNLEVSQIEGMTTSVRTDSDAFVLRVGLSPSKFTNL